MIAHTLDEIPVTQLALSFFSKCAVFSESSINGNAVAKRTVELI